MNPTPKSLKAYSTSMEEFEDGFETIGDDIDDPEIVALIELGATLINAILEKEPISNVRDLIDAGAPLWYQNEEGTSVLHAAAYVENEQLVKLLIEEGAVWNAGAADLDAHSTITSVD
jgi:protein arginine N-methyltransferase 2